MILYVQKKCKNVKQGKFANSFKNKVKEEVKTSLTDKEKETFVEQPKEEVKKTRVKKNKEEKLDNFMDANKLKQAEEIVNVLSGVDPNQIKRIKSDRGLIERTESSKVVLTEDNRQILND